MTQDGNPGSISAAEEALRQAEQQFGTDDPRLIPLLVKLAQCLRFNRLRLLEAANLEARARVLTASIKEVDEKTAGDTNSNSAAESPQALPDELKLCPFCAESIKKQAIKCRFCGGNLTASVSAPPSSLYVPPGAVNHSGKVMNNGAPDPALMALLSGCCITGLGQMLMGQVGKGFVILIASMGLGACTGGYSAFVSLPLAAIDAYCIANKLRQGINVGVWEFF